MIKKSKINILSSINHNKKKLDYNYLKTSNNNKSFLSKVISLGKKKFGRLGFRRKLIWRFFFRKQVTKHYFRFRKYRFRFFKAKFYINFFKKNLYSHIKFSQLIFYKYNLFKFIPRKNVFALLTNQQDFLQQKKNSMFLNDDKSTLLLKKKIPLKKTIINYYIHNNLFNVSYKLLNKESNQNNFIFNNKSTSFFYSYTSVILYFNSLNVK